MMNNHWLLSSSVDHRLDLTLALEHNYKIIIKAMQKRCVLSLFVLCICEYVHVRVAYVSMQSIRVHVQIKCSVV